VAQVEGFSLRIKVPILNEAMSLSVVLKRPDRRFESTTALRASGLKSGLGTATRSSRTRAWELQICERDVLAFESVIGIDPEDVKIMPSVQVPATIGLRKNLSEPITPLREGLDESMRCYPNAQSLSWL
jgi:hypothetical protein